MVRPDVAGEWFGVDCRRARNRPDVFTSRHEWGDPRNGTLPGRAQSAAGPARAPPRRALAAVAIIIGLSPGVAERHASNRLEAAPGVAFRRSATLSIVHFRHFAGDSKWRGETGRKRADLLAREEKHTYAGHDR